jgi:hypothetical protein
MIALCTIGINYIYNQIQRNIQDENSRKNKQLKENLNKIVKDYKEEADEDNKSIDTQLSDINKNRLIVEDTKETNYSGGYHDIQIIIKNVSSENINYVKIGLNFLNENKDVIQSDSIDNDSMIKPKDQQTLTKRIPNEIKYKTIETEIQEVK